MSRRKTAEDRKSQIIDQALVLADRLGPDRLTARELGLAVGLTQPGIFRHFPTMGDLWLAIAEEIGQRMTQAWQSALDATPDPVAAIRALVLAQLGQIQATPAVPAILFSRELNVKNADLRLVFAAISTGFQHHLTETIRCAQAQGRLRACIAAEDAAALLISVVQGLAIRWSLGSRGFDLGAEGARLLEIQLAMLDAA